MSGYPFAMEKILENTMEYFFSILLTLHLYWYGVEKVEKEHPTT